MANYPNPAAFLLAFRDLEYELKAALCLPTTRLEKDG
jgi:hypothetical protein